MEGISSRTVSLTPGVVFQGTVMGPLSHSCTAVQMTESVGRWLEERELLGNSGVLQGVMIGPIAAFHK